MRKRVVTLTMALLLIILSIGVTVSAAEPDNPQASDSAGEEIEDIVISPDEAQKLDEIYEAAAIDGQIPSMLPRLYIEMQMNGESDSEQMTPFSMSRTAIVTPTKKHTMYIPKTWYSLYWKNGKNWQRWGDWWVQQLPYFSLSNGRTGYCIEPFNNNDAVGSSRVPIDWNSIDCQWSKYGGSFEYEKQEGIALALAYGAPNNGKTSDNAKYATAALVWDMATGTRKASGKLRFGSISPFEKTLKNNYRDIYNEYMAIIHALENHGKVPSFSEKFAANAASKTHTLTYNPSSGKYEAVLTDQIGVLEHFNYQSNLSGLSFSKIGNVLKITATPEAASQLGNGTTFANRGHEISVGPDVCAVWASAAGKDTQIMVSLDNNLDPTPSYFKLRADVYGSARFTKTTNTGHGLGGWKINLYRDSGCSNFVGTYTTGADGTATAGDLMPGTYYAREVDESSNYPYWVFDKRTVKVTVPAGGTGTAEFHNDQMGRICFSKETNTGSNLAGWTVNLYTNSACTNHIGSYTTDGNGTVTTGNLWPGTYYARENASSDSYWECDSGVKTVVVRAGETTSDSNTLFSNTHYGRIQFQKRTNTGENLGGWNINLYQDAACQNLVGQYKTEADGLVTTGNLLPGTYFARESSEADGYWECDSGIKKVVVRAGEMATSPGETNFYNIHYGKLKIVKKTTDPEIPLDGWQFKVADGDGMELEGSPFTTDANGEITVRALPGRYIVEEIVPSDSLYYCDCENPQEISVQGGETGTVTFRNTFRPGTIVVNKFNLEGNPLAGATFCLEWSRDGNQWEPVHHSDGPYVDAGGCDTDGQITTDDNGEAVWKQLHPKLFYRITEIKAPNGYQLLGETVWEGTLPVENLTVELKTVNSPVFELPHTGAVSMLCVPAAIILCCGLILSALHLYGKKDN